MISFVFVRALLPLKCILLSHIWYLLNIHEYKFMFITWNKLSHILINFGIYFIDLFWWDGLWHDYSFLFFCPGITYVVVLRGSNALCHTGVQTQVCHLQRYFGWRGTLSSTADSVLGSHSWWCLGVDHIAVPGIVYLL